MRANERLARDHERMPPIPSCLGLTHAEAKAVLADKACGYEPARRVVLFHRSGGRCFYCDRPTVPATHDLPTGFTEDHVIPQDNKGPFVAACRSCNNMRGNLPAHTFLAIMHAIVEAQGGELFWHPWERPGSRETKKILRLMRKLGRAA